MTRPAAPTMDARNLALRFVLEMAALVGLGLGTWALTGGALRWVGVVVIPVAAITAWGVFNVPGDPSRSGEAPVVVSGFARLLVELVVLGGGGVGWVLSGLPVVGSLMLASVAGHYALSAPRVRWLLGR